VRRPPERAVGDGPRSKQGAGKGAGADAAGRLDVYRAKRDFSRTSEPYGTPPEASGDAFVVQKHAATRLHYDLRLELDGTLLSWAVTRGPSSNPADKRLAVRTEDHPLDYAAFEGRIPKGEYGGGTMMLWDRGSWASVPGKDPRKTLAEGHLHFRLDGHRMRGEWLLVRLKPRPGEKRENWILRKVQDSEAGGSDDLVATHLTSVDTGRTMEEVAAGEAPKPTDRPRAAAKPADRPKAAAKRAGRRHGPLQPFRPVQLAVLADRVPTGDGWLHEMKYDGYRTLISVGGGTARAYTRSGLDWSDRYAAILTDAVELGVRNALIDGEAVALLPDGRSSFHALQAALKDGRGIIDFFAFDLLFLDGEDLTPLPLVERKARLSKLLGGGAGRLRYSDHIVGQGDVLLGSFCDAGLEGVISKRVDSSYAGARSGDWVKTKCIKRQEFVIVGWLPSEARRGFRSLLLAVNENGRLRYAGKVGTGFNDTETARLMALMAPLAEKGPTVDAPRAAVRGAHWLRPVLVAEVAFMDVTGEGVLRHSSYVGLREDKAAPDVVAETPRAIEDALAPRADSGIAISNRDRVIFPEGRITKGGLASYYEQVAPIMLPWVRDRPISLVRCPQGREKKCFFQKHDAGSFGDAVKRIAIADKDGKEEPYLFIDSPAGLLICVQMGTIEFHGWGAGTGDLERPDRLVFDLDPDEQLAFADVVAAACHLRDRLAEIGLVTFPMLTGGKGVHVIAPLDGSTSWPEVKDFARRFATALSQAEPSRFTAALSIAKRKGRIFIDYLRNQRGATAVMPYSARARPFAPVAVPLTWQELRDSRTAARWHVADAAELVKRAGSADLRQWGWFDQKLPEV
jgi:bifunctional non-homologous end joining protein LigD